MQVVACQFILKCLAFGVAGNPCAWQNITNRMEICDHVNMLMCQRFNCFTSNRYFEVHFFLREYFEVHCY
jgi:hypothetical protein